MPEAIRELETAVQHGACGVFMRGFEVDRHLGDSYFFPLYEAAEGLNMPICAHAGNANFANFEFFGHAAGLSRFKMPVIDAFCSLILCNVPAQFPKLRFGFVEVTAQWVPYAIHFLAQRKKRRPALELANLCRDNRMYVACQTDDDLPYVLKYAGEDNIVIGSDYGHDDAASEIDALRKLKECGDVSPTAVDKILGANPSALYGI
jgi:predicted TIM-barrel fold metal-dependent hydrolase